MGELLVLEFAVSAGLLAALGALVAVAVVRRLRNGLDYLRQKDKGSWIGS